MKFFLSSLRKLDSSTHALRDRIASTKQFQLFLSLSQASRSIDKSRRKGIPGISLSLYTSLLTIGTSIGIGITFNPQRSWAGSTCVGTYSSRSGVTIDALGAVVTSTTNSVIGYFNAITNAYVPLVIYTGGNNINAIATQPLTGNLFFVNRATGKTIVYNPNTGTQTTLTGTLAAPTTIIGATFNASGNLYIYYTNKTLIEVNPSSGSQVGSTITISGIPGNVSGNSNGDIAIGTNGTLYALGDTGGGTTGTDYTSRLYSIAISGTTATATAVVASNITGLGGSAANGLAIDPATGKFYISSSLGTYELNTTTNAATQLTTATGTNDLAACGTPKPDLPTITKVFSPNNVVGIPANSTLTLTLGNTNQVPIYLISTLTDNFQTGLTVRSPNGLGGTCLLDAANSNKLTAVANSSSISLLDGLKVPAGGCTVTVNVTASTAGTFTNTIAAGALKTTAGNNQSGTTSILTVPGIDYGDAPSSYGSASHPIVSGTQLGATVTAESADYNSTLADGDTGDDGITLNGAAIGTYVLKASTESAATNKISINPSKAGFASLWIDYNQNGIFDVGEQVLNDQPVVSGAQDISFDVPKTVIPGYTFARVRYSTVAGTANTATGTAPDGEVEDYVFKVQKTSAPLTCNNTSSTIYTSLDFRHFERVSNATHWARRAGTLPDGTVVDVKFTRSGSGLNANDIWDKNETAPFGDVTTPATAVSTPPVTNINSPKNVDRNFQIDVYEAGTTIPVVGNYVFRFADIDGHNQNGTRTTSMPSTTYTNGYEYQHFYGVTGYTISTDTKLYLDPTSNAPSDLFVQSAASDNTGFDPALLPRQLAIRVAWENTSQMSFSYYSGDFGGTGIDGQGYNTAASTDNCSASRTISGTVFSDTDSSKIQNGTEAGTNGGGLNAVLLNSSNAVVATTTVAADGTYSFSNVSPATYTVLITTGTTVTITLPTNWVSTGENLNNVTDTTVDSKLLNVVVGSSNVTGANFGIKQNPAPVSTNATCGVIYGSYNGGVFNSLRTYNPTTGTVSAQIASLTDGAGGTPPIAALAVDPLLDSNGRRRIYYAENVNATAPRLFYYDGVSVVNTGITLSIPFATITTTRSDGTSGTLNDTFNRMGFATDGTLYIADGQKTFYRFIPNRTDTGGSLSAAITIQDNPNNDAGNNFRAQVGKSGGGDIAFDNNGRMYIVTYDSDSNNIPTEFRLFQILDPTTSNPTAVLLGKQPSTDTVAGLAFQASDNKLYLQGSGGKSFSWDLATNSVVSLAQVTPGSADLGSCTYPSLDPVNAVAKIVTNITHPTATTLTANDVLEYTITIANTGNLVAGNATLLDAIPNGSTYVVGTTKLNGTMVPDGSGNVMPYSITSQPVNTLNQASGVLLAGTINQATVVFRVKVSASNTRICNQGTFKYDGGPVNGILSDDPTIAVQVVDPTCIGQAVASNPNVLLVKRITAINGLLTKRDGSPLNTYQNDVAYPYDDNNNAAPTAAFPQKATDKWPATVLDTSSTFLLGAINGDAIQPNDSIEYTIYFLSSGDAAATNVLFCDRVPSNVSFNPTAFNGYATKAPGGVMEARGILALIRGTTASYTNVADGDAALYFPAGIDPTITYPSVNCGGVNDNGAVVVNLGSLPNATAPGLPTDSYGFVRFQGYVK